MSQNGYCTDGFVAATTARQRRRRRENTCRSFTCISPLFLFSRWLDSGDKSRGARNRMEKKWDKKNMKGDLDIERKGKGGDLGVVKGSLSNHDEASPFYDSSAETGKEASFNLGVGLGLIYLVAASRNELNKIVEMHKKMETLIHNVQTEVQNQENKSLSMPSSSNYPSPFSNSTVVQNVLYPEQEYDSSQFSTSQNAKRPEIGFGSNQYRNSVRMDQLEAELAAEFDRLQLPMDSDFFLNCSQRQYSEVSVMEFAAEEPGIEEDGEEQPINEYYAVPPRELERRLHELLEARQKERINELESSLERAMQQLEEKEKELSWWKETARLISQHLPAIPRMLRRDVKQPIVNRDGNRILSLGYEKCFGT